jgi:hypothetical protein
MLLFFTPLDAVLSFRNIESVRPAYCTTLHTQERRDNEQTTANPMNAAIKSMRPVVNPEDDRTYARFPPTRVPRLKNCTEAYLDDLEVTVRHYLSEPITCSWYLGMIWRNLDMILICMSLKRHSTTRAYTLFPRLTNYQVVTFAVFHYCRC